MPAAMIVSGPTGGGGPVVRRTVQRAATEKPPAGFKVKKLRGQVLVTPDRANPPSTLRTQKGGYVKLVASFYAIGDAPASNTARASSVSPSRPWRGKPTPKIRLAVYRKSGFRCVHCGWAPEVPENYDGRYALGGEGEINRRTGYPKVLILEIDHILSYFHGGRYVIDNLQALCNSCNARKGARGA